MPRHFRPWATLFVLLLLACRAAAASPEGIVIRFSHVVADDTPKGIAARAFKRIAESRSNGRIRVEVYPRSTLFDDNDEILALQMGAVEIVAPSLSKFGKIGFPSFELFDLPFLFRDTEEVHRIMRGPVGRQLLADLNRQQILGLGYLDNGFKQMSANRPLLRRSDYAGLRMRIQPSRIIAAQMIALGAQAVPLALSETRLALSTRVVDGTENPLSNFVTQGIHEVQSHLSLTQHGYLGYAVVTSQRFWQQLKPADRELLEGAMHEAIEIGNNVASAHERRALDVIHAWKETHVHRPSEAQRSELEAAMRPVYERAKTRIGARLLEQTLHELSEARLRRRP
ncbi:TRAP-type C4-dicarboxylate transport system, periplasmic component [Piscinibacter sakaiensis]|uniref:TRAP-type C4-dicarboxylate transport system, periplasmic component n=2 Tax=Piscinibacter sakaiensis TaxID=1547922 RepID=A0A0K8P528_PISS1|nr:TRAP-type C4-dicarboxylate transport system, periplasmic component [Piscinibacter sakaiensis]